MAMAAEGSRAGNRGSRRSLPHYHLESEKNGGLYGPYSLRRRRAPPAGASLLSSPPVHASTPADWRQNFAARPQADRSPDSSAASSLQDSGYGGLDSSGPATDRPSSKPTAWVAEVQRRVWGRPSFMEAEQKVRWRRVQPSQVLGLLLLTILLACIGFSGLILYRHGGGPGLDSYQAGKYRSMVRLGQEEGTAAAAVTEVPEPEPASPPAETRPDLPVPVDGVKDLVEGQVGGVDDKEESEQYEKIRNLQAELQKSAEELEIVNLEMELQKRKAEISVKIQSLNIKTDPDEDRVPETKLKSKDEKSTGDEQITMSEKGGKNVEEVNRNKKTKKVNPLVKSRKKSSKAKTSKKDL